MGEGYSGLKSDPVIGKIFVVSPNVFPRQVQGCSYLRVLGPAEAKVLKSKAGSLASWLGWYQNTYPTSQMSWNSSAA